MEKKTKPTTNPGKKEKLTDKVKNTVLYLTDSSTSTFLMKEFLGVRYTPDFANFMKEKLKNECKSMSQIVADLRRGRNTHLS